MKAIIQHVKNAKVEVENETIGEIGKGLLVFFGAEKGDETEKVQKLAEKIANLRIFLEDGKMQHSVLDVYGEVLIVSQFTLAADLQKGRRPDFGLAEEPTRAEELYEDFIAAVEDQGLKVTTGRFGAMMEVSIVNDGPQTYIIEI